MSLDRPKLQTLNSGEYTSKQLDRLLDSRDSSGYKAMLPKRERLPAYKMKDEIVSVVRKSSVVVVAGATGCGKTTQVPYTLRPCTEGASIHPH